MTNPYIPQGRDLAARERFSTPAEPKKAPAAKTPVRSPGTLTKANPNLGKTSTKPFYPGQKPDHFIPAGRGGSVPVYKYGLGSSGPTFQTVLGAPARGETEQKSQAALAKVYQQNHPVGQTLIEGLANGVPGVSLAKAIRDNHLGLGPVASEAFNDVTTGLVPAGKAAGILGGIRGLKKIKDVAETIDAGKALEPVEKTAAQKIQGGLRGARVQRGKQAALYSQERAKRVAAAEEALHSAPGMEGFHAARAAHQGELPKIKFSGFGELTPGNLDQAAEFIKTHPNLMHYQKLRVAKALEAAVRENKLPTPSELDLIQHVFGKDLSGTLKDPQKLSAWSKAVELLNVPRSLMASFDVSAPFRQGLVVGARHPRIFFKNFAPMFKALGSEKAYRGVMEDIVHRPSFPMMQEAKLSLTDFEHGLAGQEEQFIGKNYAEKIPVAGRGVRASGRAYTAFLNKTRADTFDHLIRVAQAQGRNVQDQKFLRDLGNYINAATGRGTYPSKALEQALPALNAVMFSPRLLASRLHFLNPQTYLDPRIDPLVRREALKAALATLGAGMTVLGLAKLAGAKVGDDPLSADFGKIKKGNTRIDIWGGFQQPVRLLAQVAYGRVDSSTTGKELHLGPEGPGKLTRKDIIERFGAGKLAPVPSLLYDWASGGTITGQKFNLKSEVEQRMIPLLMQDAADIYKDRHGGLDGISAALAGYGVGAFGVGLQTYGQKPSKSKAKTDASPYSGGYAGGADSPYGGTSTGAGSGNPYIP